MCVLKAVLMPTHLRSYNFWNLAAPNRFCGKLAHARYSAVSRFLE
jgi:hypothetical protein